MCICVMCLSGLACVSEYGFKCFGGCLCVSARQSKCVNV